MEPEFNKNLENNNEFFRALNTRLISISSTSDATQLSEEDKLAVDTYAGELLEKFGNGKNMSDETYIEFFLAAYFLNNQFPNFNGFLRRDIFDLIMRPCMQKDIRVINLFNARQGLLIGRDIPDDKSDKELARYATHPIIVELAKIKTA